MWVEEARGRAGPADLGEDFIAGGRVGEKLGWYCRQVVIRGERAVCGWQSAGSLACGKRFLSLSRLDRDKGDPSPVWDPDPGPSGQLDYPTAIQDSAHLRWCFSVPPGWPCKTKRKPLCLWAACSLPAVRTWSWVTCTSAPLWEVRTRKKNVFYLKITG